MSDGTHGRPRFRPQGLLLFALVAALATLIVGAGPASSTIVPSTYFVVTDEQGPNDVPLQSDLTEFGRDTSVSGLYNLFWNWNSTNWTGSNTGDACALFDYNGNGKVDAAVCSEVHNASDWTATNPDIVQTVTPPNHGFTGGPPYVFRCDDATSDRCSNPSDAQPYGSSDIKAGVLASTAGSPPAASPPGNLVTNLDPFSADANFPSDTTLEINITQSYLLTLAGNLGSKYPAISNATPTLVNVCSYPSAGNGGNNNPFDCIVNPGGGFLKIVKVANGSQTQTFSFSVTGDARGTLTKTITGSGDTGGFPVGPIGSNYAVGETVPSGWQLNGASCQRFDGSSTGTLSGSTVSGITIDSGQVTTCTFTDSQNSPAITIVKSSSDSSFSRAGAILHYSYVVTNSGNVPLTGIAVTDNNVDPPGVTCPQTSLAPGASMTCTAQHTVTQAEFDNGCKVTNSASVTSTEGASNSASLAINGTCNPHLAITKSASPASYSHVGDVITYSIVATNDGNVTLASVTVTDPSVSGLTCTPANGSSLAPGASLTCSGTHTVTQADLDAGHYANTSCVDDGPGGADQQCASKDVPGIQSPHLAITKSASPTTYTRAGDVISYTIVATNDGNIALSGVSVTDTPALAGFSCSPTIPATLAPGASVTCTGTYTITQADVTAGHVTDSACVSSTTPGSNQPCAPATVTALLPTAQILPTATTCQDFLAGGQQPLTTLTYGVQGGLINSVSPGVFFYYSKFTAPSGSFTLTVPETNVLGWKSLNVLQGQAFLYDASCNKLGLTGTETFPTATTETETYTVTGLSAGATYVIGIKYNTSSIVGQPVSQTGGVFPTDAYNYSMAINGTTLATSQAGVSVVPRSG